MATSKNPKQAAVETPAKSKKQETPEAVNTGIGNNGEETKTVRQNWRDSFGIEDNR